ncbi:carboxyl transferase domain-containing protein [Gordonia sp. ABSL11-1]|uniref:carboxyl transferase domain-containing protein n=1 Tax=Gordonia sp. ABSL11-1 TaxID=3053924 RepID=UPI00336536F6
MTEHDATAASLLDILVDRGTWESWDTPVDTDPADDDYRASMIRARERTGTDESVLTGRGRIGGVDTVLVVSEFGFLGGSIGHDAGRRVVVAIEQATAGGLPVLALPASGGTRMQEGTAAFLQMVAIAGAVVAHKAAGLLYLVYLRHPTTGGVFASWGSLGHITWAQPSALVGFLGPRVYEGLYGEPFPDGVQTAENLCRRGLVDRVLAPEDLAPTVARTLRLVTRGGGPRLPVGATDHSGDGSAPTRAGSGSAWDAVVATRADNRPGLVEFLDEEETIRIREDGPIWLALSDFSGRTAVVIGQDRRRQAAGELIAPMDLRVARRGMALAADLALPVLTVIDTPGAELSVAAEEGGLATEIARCTADLIGLPVPTVSVLLGQGAGGAALALFPADRRVAATDGWLSPLPPEGPVSSSTATPGTHRSWPTNRASPQRHCSPTAPWIGWSTSPAPTVSRVCAQRSRRSSLAHRNLFQHSEHGRRTAVGPKRLLFRSLGSGVMVVCVLFRSLSPDPWTGPLHGSRLRSGAIAKRHEGSSASAPSSGTTPTGFCW